MSAQECQAECDPLEKQRTRESFGKWESETKTDVGEKVLDSTPALKVGIN